MKTNITSILETSTILNSERLGNKIAKRYFSTTLNDERLALNDPLAPLNEILYIYPGEAEQNGYPDAGILICLSWSMYNDAPRTNIGLQMLLNNSNKLYYRRVGGQNNGGISEWKQIQTV